MDTRRALRERPLPPRIGPGEARRHIEAALHFAVAGGRTILSRQRVPYPFHITRVFHLDQRRPELATLYLQSAAGGLYRGDRLALTIDIAPGAAAHVTTQASTIVHDTRGRDASQVTRIGIAPGGFAAITPDPLVLFPGAAIASATEIVLADTASAIVTDGFARHDPKGEGRTFERYAVSTIVRDECGKLLLADRGAVSGAALASDASPLGPHRAAGTLLALGPAAERLDPAMLERRLTDVGCLAGMSRAPNEIGLAARILAPDGGALARGLAAAFASAFEAMVGVPPAPRRK